MADSLEKRLIPSQIRKTVSFTLKELGAIDILYPTGFHGSSFLEGYGIDNKYFRDFTFFKERWEIKKRNDMKLFYAGLTFPLPDASLALYKLSEDGMHIHTNLALDVSNHHDRSADFEENLKQLSDFTIPSHKQEGVNFLGYSFRPNYEAASFGKRNDRLQMLGLWLSAAGIYSTLSGYILGGLASLVGSGLFYGDQKLGLYFDGKRMEKISDEATNFLYGKSAEAQVKRELNFFNRLSIIQLMRNDNDLGSFNCSIYDSIEQYTSSGLDMGKSSVFLDTVRKGKNYEKVERCVGIYENNRMNFPIDVLLKEPIKKSKK